MEDNITNEQRERICLDFEFANDWLAQLFPISWYTRYKSWRCDRKFQRYMGYLETKRIKFERERAFREMFRKNWQ